ncbi:MAG: hypothetical protein CMM59_01175 [Rhodospirillaceae bacterium]|nr:hypothetical protein [Rhodospirillaceae bacterium]|tara:strand:- start:49 stop:555 length:507 start_codon:yes stop_codon:yes gene_type:complete
MHHAPEAGDSPSKTEHVDLPLSEQFVLWAARLWVKSQHFGPTLHLNLRNGFRAANMEEGYLMLDRVMTRLSTCATRDIGFHCTCCKGITGHEHTVLGIIAEFQTGEDENARLILSDWFQPVMVDVAGREFQEFAMLLRENGLHIRARQWFSVGGEHSSAPISPLPSIH